jgi:DNA polymerase-1
MRVMIIPDPGYVFVEGDLSQAEARVVAWAGHIPYMIETFRSGRDIHSQTASLIFKRPAAEFTKKSVERYSAKRIVHASNYDMHAPTFAKRYNEDAVRSNMPFIDIKYAQELLTLYHQAVPELRQNYHKDLQHLVETTKTVTNPFGRRMIFHDRVGPDLFRAAYAWYAQSTVADITNVILAAIAKEFDILLQVHDSILVQCRKGEEETVISAMHSANPTIIVGGEPLKIPLEFKAGSVSWYDMEEYKEVTA